MRAMNTDLHKQWKGKYCILLLLTLIACHKNLPSKENNAVLDLTIIKNDSLKTIEKGVMINNLRQGYWPSFREDGTIESEAIFLNDTLNGKFIMYSDNGIIVYEGYWLKGKPYGNWIFYHPNGKVQSKGERRDDKFVGNWEFFNEDGSLIEKKSFTP